MSSRPQENMKFISKQNPNNGKDRIHSLSPNIRPATSKNTNLLNNNINNNNSISNNLYKNKNFAYSNNLSNNLLQNYNIKANRTKGLQKEKIIEGDLYFNLFNNLKSISKQTNTLNTNKKGKNPHRMPRKSPIPIKDNNIKNKNIFFNPLLNNPKSAFGKNNSSNNKPLSSLNKNVKNLVRNNSPLLRIDENKNKIIILNKNEVKPRIVSKSPVLGKNSIYDKFKNFDFNNNNFMKSLNYKKMKINCPKNSNNINSIKNLNIFTNNQLKQINKVNNVVNGSNNKSYQPKKQTVITCEFEEENKKDHKDNLNTNLNKININNNKVNKNESNSMNKNEIKSNIEIQNLSQKNINFNNNEQKNQNTQALNNINIKPNHNTPKMQNIRLNKNGYEKILDRSNHEEIKAKIETKDKITDSKNDDLSRQKEQSKPQRKTSIHKKIKDLNIFTHVGFDGEKEKDNNQDNYFIQKNFAGHKEYIYMSVCDGHGINGHHVSNFIKTILPTDMSENLKHRNILTETEKTHELIKETFIIVNDKLVENQNIDSVFSGTTCVSVIYTPEKLICPNIGDSRAVLARYDKNKNKYNAIDLTRDHKPTESDERQRIIENDGRIQPFIEDGEFVGPERIWIKEEDVPGLAMTRSFGDRVAATVGVISEPEIKELDLNENDKFMIIASDGIWEFISSQECIDIISSYYEKNDIKGCCQFLYSESSKRWLKEEEVIDDTTLILVFFE